MTIGQMIMSLLGAFMLGYTVGMVHWVVMDCRRQDKEEAEWQARHDADLCTNSLKEARSHEPRARRT